MVFFGNPVMHTAFEQDWREAVVAFVVSAILEMQVYGRCPLCVIFLVDIHVIAIALDICFGRTVDLNPGVARYYAVFSKSGVVYHNAQLVVTRTSLCGNRYEQIMVLVAYKRNLDIVPFEFLIYFGTVIDAVLDKSATFDFPAVVDAATGRKACNDERNEKFKRTREHFVKMNNGNPVKF